MSATAIPNTEDAPQARDKFSFAQARGLIGDLTKPNPKIYWTDFLISIIGGHSAIMLVRWLPEWYPNASWMMPAVAAAYIVTVVLYMRSLMFIHELIHLPKGEFKAFRVVWNLLCGIIFLVPSYLYYPHVDHHRRKHYGTEHDGEYVSLSHYSPFWIVAFIVQALLIPFLIFFRFLVLSPICWLIPGARNLVHRHASTMLVDPTYVRTDGSRSLMKIVFLQELGCFAWCVTFLTAWYFKTGEWFNPMWVVGYSVALGILVLNEVRTLGAHRWTNKGGEMTFEEQLVDSVNYPNYPWFSELWGPVGTRYHAVHHLFPSLPYHNLGEAHRRLVKGLPANSIYHDTIAKSLPHEIIGLWNRARNRKATKPANV